MPFAFWPVAPAVSQAWLDFLDFASVRADGTWLFRGHGDAAFDLIPAIGRQPSAAAYRLADEKTLFEEFVREARRYFDADGFTELEWLAVAQHHGFPTRLPANPMVAAWFATEDESNSTDAEIVALRVPFVRRLRTAQVFSPAGGAPVLVEVPPRAARITAQRGFSPPIRNWHGGLRRQFTMLRHFRFPPRKKRIFAGFCIYSAMIRNGSMGIWTHSARRWRGVTGNAKIFYWDRPHVS
jgi:hypothetical protein